MSSHGVLTLNPDLVSGNHRTTSGAAACRGEFALHPSFGGTSWRIQSRGCLSAEAAAGGTNISALLMLRMTTTGPFPASWRSILKMEFGGVLLMCLPDWSILYHWHILLWTLKLGRSHEGVPITEKRLTRIRPPLVAQLCYRKITPTPNVFDLFCRMLVINTLSGTPWSTFLHSNV